jgi:raffinose/stachyose/melibiose transport system permease protein
MRESKALKIFKYTFTIIYSLVIMVPIVWMIISSLKPNNEVMANPWSLPKQLYLKNYIEAIQLGLGRFLLNSIIITAISVIIIVLLGSMAAFVFARYKFRFRKPLFFLLISGMMVPVLVALIPLYDLTSKLGLFNNFLSVIGPYIGFGLPFTTFILWGYFLTVPKELEESARIDGCSPLRIYWNIIIPVSKPAIGTVVVFQSYIIWNEFLFALVFLRNQNVRTLPVGIFSTFTSYMLVKWGGILAGLFTVLFLIFQNSFVRGLTAGALKE